jgi:hypothetical protein
MRPPIPQRIAPLTWRKPAILWTPLALAMAIGWPAALFQSEPGLQRLAVAAGAAVFALALISLGASWALGRAPRARRTVVTHVVAAGAIAALASPFVLTELLASAADYRHAGAGETFTLSMSLAMAPLALLLGLPISLISGFVFAWVALARGRIGEGDLIDFRNDSVQPFR